VDASKEEFQRCLNGILAKKSAARNKKGAAAMTRVCFVLKVRPERIEEYKRRHQEVWPEMLDALQATGWHNYSLFLRADGLLVGYLETPDFERARAGMQDHAVNARWQAEMAPFFETLDHGAADASMMPLEEVFHLD
jgi:L-rhamnose mutarotase